MIVRMQGTLCEVREQYVILERGGIGHEVLVPGYAVGELGTHRGREVVLHTLEFLEGNAANSNLVPRLIGFPQEQDRAFFQRFIEVKGIGPRKALRAFSEPIPRIARWILDGDVSMLAGLPGIGRRGAEMIVAALKGKIDQFAAAGVSEALPATEWSEAQRDALEVMLAWGDGRNEAVRWLERAAQLPEQIETADEWVRACYRIKAGSEA